MKSYIENLFVNFNSKYFYGLIPNMKICYGKKHLSQWAKFETDIVMGERIVLSPLIRDYQMALEGILLHEMIHAYLWWKYQGLPIERSYLWLDHTDDFLAMEKMINKRHFKNNKAHVRYFNLMNADLKKKHIIS